LWAVIGADASLARSSGATGAHKISDQFNEQGQYEVDFNRDVTQCAYVASRGTIDIGSPSPGLIGATRRDGNPNGVFVETWNPDGVLADSAFHLVVVC
jgi:hypothetical protein